MREGGNTPSLFSLPARPQSCGREFSALKHYSIFSLARAPGKLHKKIPKTFYSLCILPIAICIDIWYNNNVPKRYTKNRQAKKDLKKVKKMLDKWLQVWYNKNVPKR